MACAHKRLVLDDRDEVGTPIYRCSSRKCGERLGVIFVEV